MDMPETVAAIQQATRLRDSVFATLDLEKGGIGFITDQIGWRHSALLGEYLLSSIDGVSESLNTAARAADEYQRTQIAENMAWGKALKELGDHIPESEKIGLAKQALGEESTARDEKMRIYADHVLISLGQALDRLAAVVVIVAGLGVEVIRTDWRDLEQTAKKSMISGPPQGLRSTPFSDPESEGRRRQIELLDITTKWQDYGPTDWLPWLRAARNEAVHRAPKRSWRMMPKKPANPGDRAVEVYWAQPGWAETETVFRGIRKSYQEVFLMNRPYDVMQGLIGSVAQLVTAMLTEATELWSDRRADRSLIVQNPKAWPEYESSETLSFPGYGDKIVVGGDTVVLHPDTVTRMRAARLHQDQIREWKSSEN